MGGFAIGPNPCPACGGDYGLHGDKCRIAAGARASSAGLGWYPGPPPGEKQPAESDEALGLAVLAAQDVLNAAMTKARNAGLEVRIDVPGLLTKAGGTVQCKIYRVMSR